MHDSSGEKSAKSSMSALLIAIILLASVLILFRKPASTMTDFREVAVHASALSLSDPTWSDNQWIFREIEPPAAGEVSFGRHELYPYSLITARDAETGDVLVRIFSPLGIPWADNFSCLENTLITTVVRNRDGYVLSHQQNSESWPVRLFSIITGG